MVKQLWCAALTLLALAGVAAAQDDWKIVIRPAGSDEPVVEKAAPPAGAKMSYDDAYNMVTYHKAEYLANPGYRHDAALELMFGAMRPTTVVRSAYGPRPSYYYYPRRYIYNARSLWVPPYSLYAKDLY